jgi:hypothetical protein
MDLDKETEQELMEEIRSHLEESVAAARARGLNEQEALVDAAARFGVDEVGPMLQEVHAGWGTGDAVYAAAIPVVCTLGLRWMVFDPDGTTMGWPQLLDRPAFWAVSAAALAVPMLKLRRWRYGLLSWGFFWGTTLIFAIMPTLRW